LFFDDDTLDGTDNTLDSTLGQGGGDSSSQGQDDLTASDETIQEMFRKGEESAFEQKLGQTEIESLLGINHVHEKNKQNAIESLVNSNLVYYERLPMLEVVFDRLVRMLSTSLRNFTSDNVEVIFDNLTTIRFGDYLNSVSLPAMLGVFRAEQWDNQGLFVVDSRMIYSVVDVLLGGRRGDMSSDVDSRPYTTIERNLIDRMIRIILNDMHTAFDPICYVNFRFERLETNPRFAMIARAANAAILVRLRVEMEERGGTIDLILPYATIEPIRELLLQNFMGEKFGRDSIWENHLAEQLWNTDMVLQATLPQETYSLEEVLQWKVGTQITFNCDPTSPVRIVCEGYPLMEGRMGQKGGKIAVKIDDVLFKEEGQVHE
jgi:flagellar motor switch protein FliM